MAWESAPTSATQLTTISDTEQLFDATIQLLPGEGAHVEINVDFAGTTDHMIVSVYGSIDDSVYDDMPIMEFTIDKDQTDRDSDGKVRASFTLDRVYAAQIGVRSSGATDDHTSADMRYRKDQVQL